MILISYILTDNRDGTFIFPAPPPHQHHIDTRVRESIMQGYDIYSTFKLAVITENIIICVRNTIYDIIQGIKHINYLRTIGFVFPIP